MQHFLQFLILYIFSKSSLRPTKFKYQGDRNLKFVCTELLNLNFVGAGLSVTGSGVQLKGLMPVTFA